MEKSLSIIIPCYNEQKCILPLFKKIEQLISLDNSLEIIIVDNGSVDDSSFIIKDHNLYKQNKIKLITIKKNIGYGHGVMEGLKTSTSNYVSWCHSDLEIDPLFNLSAFKENKINLDNEKCIIKGYRIARPILDILFTFGMSIFASLVFKTKLRDVNAQPKIFRKEFLKLIKTPPIDFSFDLYALVIAKYNNYKIINYPVLVKKRIAGLAKGGGGSLFNKIKLAIKTVKYIFKLKKQLKSLSINF